MHFNLLYCTQKNMFVEFNRFKNHHEKAWKTSICWSDQLVMMVSLDGWSTPREIIEYDGKLYFEVAEQGHCYTCQSRIAQIYSVVSLRNLQVSYGHLLDRFPRAGRTLWVGIEKPKPNISKEEIKNLFCESLELPILCIW